MDYPRDTSTSVQGVGIESMFSPLRLVSDSAGCDVMLSRWGSHLHSSTVQVHVYMVTPCLLGGINWIFAQPPTIEPSQAH